MNRVRGKLLLTAAIAGLAVALSGCSAGRDSANQDTPTVSKNDGGAGDAAAPEAAQQNAGQAAPPAQQGEAAGQPGAAAPGQVRQEDRSIVYSGDITVRVDNVDVKADQLTTLVEGAGGFIGGDKRSRNDRGDEAHLTIRVPGSTFISMLDQIAGLGAEETRNVNTEDVTQQVIDLDAQIASQKASVDRTRALLARAQTIGEIVSVEAELAKRESALATLEARKRRIADLVALSTVTVHLLGPDAPAKAGEDDPSFLTGLKAGWNGFLGSMNVLLTILGFLLPFLVVLGIPLGALWWFFRRRRRPPPAVEPAPQEQ